MRFWKQIAVALQKLSPETIRREAKRPFSLALVGAREELDYWTAHLLPSGMQAEERERAMRRLFAIPLPISGSHAEMLPRLDVVLVTAAAAPEFRAYTREYFVLPGGADLKGRWAAEIVDEIWQNRSELAIPLARHFPPMCGPVIQNIVKTVARENATFAIISAVPNVVPSPITLPWAIGEFASDTAVITANQFRMAFLIAAANDAPVGWRQQRAQVASIAGSAFGLRALAREIAGKIPAGGGLVAKGLIAYAATYAMGRGLAQFHRVGRPFTRGERREAYRQAWLEGKKVVDVLVRRLRPRRNKEQYSTEMSNV